MVFADDPIAAWGQAAAIYLTFQIFFLMVIGLVLALVLMFALGWVRDKAELLKKLRPFVNSVNNTAVASMEGRPDPANAPSNKIVHTVAQLPSRVTRLDEKVNEGSDKVAKGVIEFNARFEMGKTFVKQLFLPGLYRKETVEVYKAPGSASPGFQVQANSLNEYPTLPNVVTNGNNKDAAASELKDARTR